MVEEAGALVLDTHVWLWAVQGSTTRLSPEAIQRIETASQEGHILVSAISVWEVAMLEARGRISLSRPVEEWTRAALRAPGVDLVALTPEIAGESTRLPGEPHGDPADRILMATARVTGATLATCDAAILAYAEQGHLAALDGRP